MKEGQWCVRDCPLQDPLDETNRNNNPAVRPGHMDPLPSAVDPRGMESAGERKKETDIRGGSESVAWGEGGGQSVEGSRAGEEHNLHQLLTGKFVPP